jgi:hypothetical protein
MRAWGAILLSLAVWVSLTLAFLLRTSKRPAHLAAPIASRTKTVPVSNALRNPIAPKNEVYDPFGLAGPEFHPPRRVWKKGERAASTRAKPLPSTPFLRILTDDMASLAESTEPIEANRRATPEAVVAKINKALDSLVDLDITDAPLNAFVAELARKTSVGIRLDNPALLEAGTEPDSILSKQVSGVRLRSALRLLLCDLQLKVVIQDGEATHYFGHQGGKRRMHKNCCLPGQGFGFGSQGRPRLFGRLSTSNGRIDNRMPAIRRLGWLHGANEAVSIPRSMLACHHGNARGA